MNDKYFRVNTEIPNILRQAKNLADTIEEKMGIKDEFEIDIKVEH